METFDHLTDPAVTWSNEWQRLIARQSRYGGGESLARLKQFAAVKPGHLSEGDRERLASALHLEVERLTHLECDERPFSRAAWMRAAGLDDPGNATKRYGEYVLAPWYSMDYTTWGQRRKKLHVGAAHFVRLIEALFSFSHDTPEQICHRVFAGTSFAGDAVAPERYSRVAGQLVSLVRATDSMVAKFTGERGIEGLFKHTAEAKRRMIAANVTPPSWPFPDWFYGHDGVPDVQEVYWDERDTAQDRAIEPPEHLAYDTTDPRYRNLMRMTLDWLDSLVHLPRAYLGSIAFTDELHGTSEEIGAQLATGFRLQQSVVEQRELSTGRARIKGIHPADVIDGAAGPGETIPLLEQRHPEEEEHCWLVIYPAKDRKGLCPMLYWPRAEAGVFVCPLNADNLHALSAFCVTSDDGVVTLFERLESMIAAPSRQLARAWAQTAFDLCSNPVLEAAAMHGVVVPSRGQGRGLAGRTVATPRPA